jgi:hypothetical protein
MIRKAINQPEGYIDVSLLEIQGKQIGLEQLHIGDTMLQALVAGLSHDDIIEFSKCIESFRPLYGPEADSASNRYEFQKSF